MTDERIVTTYEMRMDASLTSVSVATVEFQPEGAGTRLTYTEQGAFLDGLDDVQSREAGTRDLLDQLDSYLRQTVRRCPSSHTEASSAAMSWGNECRRR